MATDFENKKLGLFKSRWIIGAVLLVLFLYGMMEILDIEKPIHKTEKTMIELDVSGIFEIDVNGPAGFYRITKDITEQWKLNDSLSINQALVESYILQFEKIALKNYRQSIDISNVRESDRYSLLIKSADELVDVEIKCYKIDNPEYRYVLQSNRNQAFFLDNDGKGLKTQLFWKHEQFQ